MLAELTRPTRDPSLSPTMQLGVILQNVLDVQTRFGSLASSLLFVEVPNVQYELCYIFGARGGFFSRIRYAASLFAHENMLSVGQKSMRLLAEGCGAPDRPVRDLNLFEPGERAELLRAGLGPRQPPAPRSMPEAIREHAERAPDAVAVESDEGTLTYAELLRAAGLVATRLLEHGVGDGQAVGVAIARSLDQIVAAVGVLTAGAVLLPIELDYPEERRRFTLHDSKARVCLLSRHVDEGVATMTRDGGVTVVPVDWREQLERASTFRDPQPESAAYIVYTSGSTGTPKGVVVPHRALLRTMRSQNFTAFGPDTVMLHQASFSFDGSLLELWGALLNGGRLVIGEPGPPTVASLAARLRRYGVKSAFLPTGLFHAVADSAPETFAPLAEISVGGDALHAARSAPSRKRAPACA